MFPPWFNRYEGAEAFGTHVDNAVRIHRASEFRVRSDLSATLFLENPDAYEGGELVVVSVSGSSPKLVRALESARGREIVTVGLLGKNGGKALALCDHAVVVRSEDYGWVESVHVVLHHGLLLPSRLQHGRLLIAVVHLALVLEVASAEQVLLERREARVGVVVLRGDLVLGVEEILLSSRPSRCFAPQPSSGHHR
jgi:hypothetical protein